MQISPFSVLQSPLGQNVQVALERPQKLDKRKERITLLLSNKTSKVPDWALKILRCIFAKFSFYLIVQGEHKRMAPYSGRIKAFFTFSFMIWERIILDKPWWSKFSRKKVWLVEFCSKVCRKMPKMPQLSYHGEAIPLGSPCNFFKWKKNYCKSWIKWFSISVYFWRFKC